MADKSPFYANARDAWIREAYWEFFFEISDNNNWSFPMASIKSGSTSSLTTPNKKLEEVITLLRAQGKSWPVGGYTNNRDFLVTWKDNGGKGIADALLGHDLIIVSAQLTSEAYTKAMQELNPTKKTEYGIKTDSLRNAVQAKYSNYALQWDHIPLNRDWIVTGRIVEVLDGDTFDLKVSTIGNKVASNPNSRDIITVGSRIRVRLLGVNAPETKKDFSTYDDTKNADFARKYHVDSETAYNVANEAKKFTKNILDIAHGSIIIDIDVDNNGNPKISQYDNAGAKTYRFVSMAFKSLYDNVDADLMTVSDWYINLNKSLVANPSSYRWIDQEGTEKAIPLAVVDGAFQYGLDNTKYDYAVWEETIAYGAQEKVAGIEEAVKKAQEDAKVALERELENIRDNNGQTMKLLKEYKTNGTETIDYIVRKFRDMGYAVDTELVISTNNLQQLDDGSYFIPSGELLYIPVIELVKDDANTNTFKFTQNSENLWDNTLNFFAARDDRRDMVTPYHVRIGDVQLIIPPLSITVDQKSSLQKVKPLRTKSSIITKAGSSQKTITLQLYFHDLDSINGIPVVYANGSTPEYFYMDGLRPLIAEFKKAPFLPIENEHINDVHGITDVILANLSVATVPGFPRSLAATLTLAAFDHEAYMPHVEFLDRQINYPMFRWYYQQVMGENSANNPYRTYLAPIEGALTNNFAFQMAVESDLITRQESIRDLRFFSTNIEFDNNVKNGKNLFGRMQRDGDRLRTIQDQRRRYLELKASLKNKFPKSFKKGDDAYNKIYGEDFNTNTTEALFVPPEFDPGTNRQYMLIQIESQPNLTNLPIQAIYNESKSMYKFYFDADQRYIDVISKNGDNANLGIKAYKTNYQKLTEMAQGSEGVLPMEDVFIDDLYITAMNIVYENSFSAAQTQLGEQPTFQYLGGQDPYLQVTFETTSKQAVADLKQLIEKADHYSKAYRQGITTGFIGFKNQLAQLFGITTVMIETCTVHTVPGFVSRYQIDVTMCGFNKTQRRTEMLDGFSAAYSTDKADRSVTKNPVSQDAIIVERKLKDLELYPDLELPTFRELNDALKKIDAGISIYHNPNGAKYVDPDFYFSTNWTFRSYFQKYRNHPDNYTDEEKDSTGLMELQDVAGNIVKMRVYGNQFAYPDDESLFVGIDSRAKSLQGLEQQVLWNVDSTNMNSFLSATTDEQVDAAVHQIKNQGPVDRTSVKTWLQNYENVYVKPSFSEWAAWNGVDTSKAGAGVQADNYTRALQQPSHLDVYKAIYALVDEFFVRPGYVVDERTMSDVVKQNITYARSQDIADANYMWLKNNDKRFATASSIDMKGNVTYKDMNLTGGRITRERIANYIKAKLDLENGWKQFDKKNGVFVPSLNPTAPAAGIGQIMLSVHANSINEAKRLAWDWKYNIRFAVRYFVDKYERAIKSTDISVRCRPWDWAVRWYNLPGVHPPYLDRADPAWKVDDGRYFGVVMNRFEGSLANVNVDPKKRKGAWYNSPDSRYNTPGVPNDPNVYAYLNNLNPSQVAVIGSDTNTMRKVLKEKTGMSDDKIGKMTDQEVKTEFDKWAKAYSEMYGSDLGKAFMDANLPEFNVYNDYQNVEQALKQNLLVNNEDPNVVFRDMFTDMTEYDHRGRMLRAFPTFQMFLIDEGRWMSTYRLWDNLYGFNSIVSIDVHKSRKIAADTAVITMTNVYSNLTSRKMDVSYGDWTYSIWDQFIWGNPSQQLLDARKELVTSLFLQTGARIHLRMGYGSDATSLPVMFNGTITEMDTQDVVTIIAQGDGLELTNIISADIKETNEAGRLGRIIEPRDLLCKLLTSKGNWFKDAINYVSGGKFFIDNPLGIQHFGSPAKTPETNAKISSVFGWYADGSFVGEAVQNIYSSNGENTFSQWRYQDGTEIDPGWSWANLFSLDLPKGDEMNIKLKYYGQTVWSVAQTLAYCSPDYIAAVHPFELRSTLFFGKPYYRLAYRYDSQYTWDKIGEGQDQIVTWKRIVTSEYRKPYQQFHVFNSTTDIINNRIKASSDGMYTNVIATYEGKQSDLQQADFDIMFSQQTTTVVETPIVAQGFTTFWTAEKQANFYAQSTLRDSVKDMYKGVLLVLGDPTVKPHDMCHLDDSIHDMNGPFLVKEVVHSFSQESGFITSISPDAVVVIDDMGTLGHTTWFTSIAAGFATFLLGKKVAARSFRKMVRSVGLLRSATEWTGNVTGKALTRLAASLPHEKGDLDFKEFKDLLDEFYKTDDATKQEQIVKKLEETTTRIRGKLTGANVGSKTKTKLANNTRKGLVSLSEKIVANLRSGRNALALLRVGGLATSLMSAGVSVAVDVALTIMFEHMAEAFRRKKKARQALMILPMQYQGRNFTSGLNGSQGAIVGTKPGKMDQFYMGAGYGGQSGWTKFVGKALNWMFDGDVGTQGTVKYQTTYEDLANSWDDNGK